MVKTCDYEWTCHACEQINPAGSSHCIQCKCPAFASSDRIEQHLQGQRQQQEHNDEHDRRYAIGIVCFALLWLIWEFFLQL